MVAVNQQQGSALFKWYLALLRSDAKLRAERQSMTPLTLVERDNARIQEMIEKSGNARTERSVQILSELKKRKPNLGMIGLMPGGARISRLLDDNITASSKLLGVLGGDANSEKSIDKLADEIISELERARQGERLIADYTSDLLCCLDENLLVLEINLEFELKTGYQKLSIAAVPLDKFIPENHKEPFVEYLQQRRDSSESEAYEGALKAADGRLIDLEWNVEWSQSSHCYFCRAKDITERKERDRLREQVRTMARHDMRTPLTGIGLVLDNMQLGTYGILSEAGIEKAEQARASIEKMVELIDNLIKVE